MKIRAKHGPHIAIFYVHGSNKIELAFKIGQAALNVAYGLKLESIDGITLEVLGH